MLRVLDLFSGIGAYSLGLERTGGFKTVAFCECEDFPRRVLAKHWPDVPIYDDVRTLTADTLARDGIAVDVIVGGWPCQDISPAGTRSGLDGARSGLWSEIARLAGEIRPRFLILENSAALLSSPPEQPGRDFGIVLRDLAALGYDAEWHCLSAAAFDAPHIRDRLWIVAFANSDSARLAFGKLHAGSQRRKKRTPTRKVACVDGAPPLAHANGIAPIGSAIARQERHTWDAEPRLDRVATRSPLAVDRVRALGNCNPPIVPEAIGRAILESLT